MLNFIFTGLYISHRITTDGIVDFINIEWMYLYRLDNMFDKTFMQLLVMKRVVMLPKI
jgi:hypothetical protein